MADHHNDESKPRPWWGFGFLAEAFRTVFAVNHPARRGIAPAGFPVRVMAEVGGVQSAEDGHFISLNFQHGEKSWTAAIQLPEDVEPYRQGECRPMFINPATKEFAFGAVRGRYSALPATSQPN